jgi:DNA-binding SARP family transcriptional activator/predicted negative regulator of RcsB-dependent stress response
MEFRILGPLEATDSSGPARLTAGKQQALLALLLLHADRVVGVDRLVDDLWGERVPGSAQKMVQVYVSRLRKQLPEGLLLTRPPGYLLALEGHSLDLRGFEQLDARGRSALAEGRADEAARLLRDALALWRGPALAEFDEPFAALESSRMEEQRLACLEERIDADLALGRHAELVGELDALVSRHRHRERLRGQLMLALYRSGRHAEALESYQSFRRMLVDELGIDPSARLKELHRRMLEQNPSLDLGLRNGSAIASAIRSAVETRPPGLGAPPAGRERELGQLQRLLEQSLSGERRLTFVTGEAGIGKTTIVESFLARIGSAGSAAVAHGQCVEHRGAGEPYLPVLEALARLARQPTGRQLVPLLARQAPTWLAQMPWLLADDELEKLRSRLLGATHERMLREMVEALDEVTAELPLILVLEDLHWSDPSTIDLLDALARRRESARLLVLGTYRRGEAVAREHPVHRLAAMLRSRGLCSEIAVGPLDESAVAGYLATRIGGDASPELAAVLRERTGGNPLFVTTLLDSWLEHGLLDEHPPDAARISSHVPDTVRELIEEMLERVDLADRDLLSAASAVGRGFSAAAVASAAARSNAEVEVRFESLARSGRFVERNGEERWPDGTQATRYGFVHDLHREVLYDRLPAGRRAQFHSRIGRRLESAYQDRPKEIAATVAEHFVRAGDAPRAVRSLRLAAEQAFERLAHREALEHIHAGLAMVERLPAGSEAWSEEIRLRWMLGAAQIALQGWSAAEAESAFVRARELAERLEGGDDLGWALFRLATFYEVRGEYERSEALLEQALAQSDGATSNGFLADSYELLACSLFHQGVFEGALEHAEQGLAVYDGEYFNPVTAAYGDNAGAACHGWAALSLWFLGHPDLARGRAREAVALADDPRRRHARAAALTHAAVVEQCRLDTAETRALARAAREVAVSDGYAYRVAMATILHGWATAAEGAHEQGIAELERGFELSRATGAHMDDPYYFALLADARLRAGRVDAARDAAEAGLAQGSSGRRSSFESELHRLAGEALLRLGKSEEGPARLHHALDVARSQGSPALELRAALSLSGLLRDAGESETARRLVEVPYAKFGEGFATHDLVAARRLLEELAD